MYTRMVITLATQHVPRNGHNLNVYPGMITTPTGRSEQPCTYLELRHELLQVHYELLHPRVISFIVIKFLLKQISE